MLGRVKTRATNEPYPGTSYASTAAQNALTRWLDQQKKSQEQFATAEQPLQQAVGMFQPGGGYGRGQTTLLRGEARRAQAEATTQQVASGMSSGSLATGTKMRTERDLATGLAGVEDVRTQFLNQALAMLSGLRGTQAQTTAGLVDPTYAPYMSYRGGVATAGIGAMAQQNIAAGQQSTQMKVAEMQRQTEMAKLEAARQNKPSFSVPRF